MERKTYFIIAIVCIVATILYCVLPIDFVPDFITGIGWLDDVLFGAVGFIGGLVNFFIGLTTGINLAKQNRIMKIMGIMRLMTISTEHIGKSKEGNDGYL